MWTAPLFALVYSEYLTHGAVAEADRMWNGTPLPEQADMVLALAGQAHYAARRAGREPSPADLPRLCPGLRAWVQSAYLRGVETWPPPRCSGCLRRAAAALSDLRARHQAGAS